jgi:hypothetical protein
MPEPLTFDISLQGDEWLCIQASPSRAARISRVGGYDIRPSRPIVAQDFRDYDQRCDLAVLGYYSKDFRPETPPTCFTDAQALTSAYHSLGLERGDEYARIARMFEGTNGDRIETYLELVTALDNAVLEAVRRRAVI